MKQRVVIVGAGALGSHLALLLRNVDATLALVDFDRIERKNVASQFHTTMSLGRNKALALQQALQGLFGVKIEAVPHKLTTDNVEALLGHATLVIDCTDNAEARRVIQAYVRKNKVPCLHGAVTADGTFARVVWDDLFVADEEGAPGQATCENGENLPFMNLTASYLAVLVQRFLKTGQRKSLQLTPTSLVWLS